MINFVYCNRNHPQVRGRLFFFFFLGCSFKYLRKRENSAVCLCSSNRIRGTMNFFAPPTTRGHCEQNCRKKTCKGRWGEDRMRGCRWMNTLIIVRTREWLKMVWGVKKCKLKKWNLWFSLSCEERAALKWNCCSRRDSLNLCLQMSSCAPVNMSVFFTRWLELTSETET